MRLRFSAGRRASALRVAAGPRPRVTRSDDDEYEYEEDEPLEMIDGELVLPAQDPDKPVVRPLPQRFPTGFAKPAEPAPHPRSI